MSIDLAIISQCTYYPFTTYLAQSNDVSGSISDYKNRKSIDYSALC